MWWWWWWWWCRVGGKSADAKRNVILLNSCVFGAIHILNLYGTRYGATYIALQIVLGSVIGLFYSLRFMLSATIIEPIVLHAANNFFSRYKTRRHTTSDAYVICSFPHDTVGGAGGVGVCMCM